MRSRLTPRDTLASSSPSRSPRCRASIRTRKFDIPAMYVILTARDGTKLGKYLFCASRDEQWIKLKDKDGKYIRLPGRGFRYKQTQRDYSIHLDKFDHDVFPGTTTPKDFHSYIRLTDEKEGIVNRKHEIYMNAPHDVQG